MIRVFIVHDVSLMCNALATVLADEPDMTIVGVADGLADALVQLRSEPCDVVLANVSNPSREFLAFVHEMTGVNPSCRIVAVGVTAPQEYVVQCFQAGITSYALTEDTLEQLVANIRAAYQGQVHVSPHIAAALIARVAELSRYVSKMVRFDNGARPMSQEELTSREEEVLALIAQGHSNQELAEALVIEVGTVKNHVHNVLKKLNVNSREDAALFWHMRTKEVENRPSIPASPAAQSVNGGLWAPSEYLGMAATA